ncbi:hypothetical protein GMSM_06220 [Geomonas sp. Red276]
MRLPLPIAALRVAWRMRRQKPTFLSFNVSNRCNEACPMCSVWCTPAEELPFSEIERILADLNSFGFLVVEVSGGEPFLRPDLFEIFHLLDRLGFLYTTTTNGTVFNASHLAGFGALRGLLQLAVSLDTLDRKLYRQLRGRDLLPEALAALDLLATSPPPQPVKLNMTLSRLNYRETLTLLDFASERGFYLSVFPVAQGGGFSHRGDHPQFAASDEERREMAELFRELARLRREGAPLWEYSGFYDKAADYLTGGRMGECGAGRLFADLHTDGRLAPCVDLPPVADLRREGIREGWARVAGCQERIRHCAEFSPCCYTCSYNLSLTAEHPLDFLRESLRVRRPGWRSRS